MQLIRRYLATLHQLTLSVGAIIGLLHRARDHREPNLQALKTQTRANPIPHVDETGWREDSQNCYIWAFSTPGEEAVRYYEYDRSRSHVVKRVLDGRFDGHLVTDFSAYNDYAGKHQRCWTHLLRDLRALKDAHPDDLVVQRWALSGRATYAAAQTWLVEHPHTHGEERERQYVALASQTHQLGLPYAQAKAHPCQALAKRLLRHEDELF